MCTHIAVSLLMLLYYLHNQITVGTMRVCGRSLLLITAVLARNPFPINGARISKYFFFSPQR